MYYSTATKHGSSIEILTETPAVEVELIIDGTYAKLTSSQAEALAKQLVEAADLVKRQSRVEEAKDFMRAMTGVSTDYAGDTVALEYYARAKEYFENQEHDALEGKN